MNWLITVPQTRINDFLTEIEMAKHEPLIKRFKVPPNMKEPRFGDALYIVYDGAVRGMMPIRDNEVLATPFKCTATACHWDAARYLVCEISKYTEITDGAKTTGFQGLRRYRNQ